MTDSKRKNITSSGTHPVADVRAGHGPAGMSGSRRILIGVIVLLMLCGYFFVEDRPRPVETGHTVEDLPQAELPVHNVTNDLKLTNQTVSPDQPNQDLSVNSSDPSQDNSVTQVLPPQSSPQQHRHDVYHSSQTSSRTAVRPTLRFAGRIEPLQ